MGARKEDWWSINALVGSTHMTPSYDASVSNSFRFYHYSSTLWRRINEFLPTIIQAMGIFSWQIHLSRPIVNGPRLANCTIIDRYEASDQLSGNCSTNKGNSTHKPLILVMNSSGVFTNLFEHIFSQFLSHSAHRTPNFMNPQFQFPQFKVLQSILFSF